jgi:hypothetical protein
MTRATRLVLLLATGLACTIALAVVINALARSGDGQAWVAVATGVGTAAVSLIAALSSYYFGRRSTKATHREATSIFRTYAEPEDLAIYEYEPTSRTAALLLDIARIEARANDELARRYGGARPRSLFELRAELRRAGIWTDDDVKSFDRALTIRNRIVHGDPEPSRSQMKAASRDTSRLLDLLDQAAPPTQGGIHSR